MQYEVEINGTRPKVTKLGTTLTSGSVNAFTVKFSFSEEWDGLDLYAIFESSSSAVYEILLDDSKTCFIPWETLQDSSGVIRVGAYGKKKGEEYYDNILIRSSWVSLSEVSLGVPMGIPPSFPTIPDSSNQTVKAIPISEIDIIVGKG